MMKRIMMVALCFGAAVFLAEITMGSESFPLHFWYFDQIPAWRWSVPVHLAGFAWMAFSVSRFSRSAPMAAVTAAWAFFAAAECLNLLVFRFFSYSPEPLGRAFSFAAVLLLYLALCGACCYALRRPLKG